MKTTLINAQGPKTFAVVFDKGDEVMDGLLRLARDQRLGASHFTAIGAFSDVTLGYFERDRKRYKKIPIGEQVEVLSLVGDIARQHGEPAVHAHVVLGKADGTAWGGHLLEAHVWPTLEVMLEESPLHLHRVLDQETGLALLEHDQPTVQEPIRTATEAENGAMTVDPARPEPGRTGGRAEGDPDTIDAALRQRGLR